MTNVQASAFKTIDYHPRWKRGAVEITCMRKNRSHLPPQMQGRSLESHALGTVFHFYSHVRQFLIQIRRSQPHASKSNSLQAVLYASAHASTHPRTSLLRLPGEPACLGIRTHNFRSLIEVIEIFAVPNCRRAINMIYLTFDHFRRGDARRLAPPGNRDQRSWCWFVSELHIPF